MSRRFNLALLITARKGCVLRRVVKMSAKQDRVLGSESGVCRGKRYFMAKERGDSGLRVYFTQLVQFDRVSVLVGLNN